MLQDLHAGEQHLQVRGHHVFQGDEPTASQMQSAAATAAPSRGRKARCRSADCGPPPPGSATTRRCKGEGVRRVHRQRVSTGKTLSPKNSTPLCAPAPTTLTSGRPRCLRRPDRAPHRPAGIEPAASSDRGWPQHRIVHLPRQQATLAARTAMPVVSGASDPPPAPCRTRRGCWRRWPGTWPAQAAAAGHLRPVRAPAG